MKVFLILVVLFASVISNIQCVGLDKSPTNMDRRKTSTTLGLSNLVEEQALEEDFADIEQTITALDDSISTLSTDQNAQEFLGQLIDETMSLALYNEDLQLLNSAVVDMGRLIHNPDNVNMVRKGLTHLDNILVDAKTHRDVNDIIEHAYNMTQNEKVLGLKEKAVPVLENAMADPMAKINVGKAVLHAMRMGQTVEQVSKMTGSLTCLNRLLNDPNRWNMIVNQLRDAHKLVLRDLSSQGAGGIVSA